MNAHGGPPGATPAPVGPRLGGPTMTTHTSRRPKSQRFEVEGLTRVEGEGSLRLVVKDGEVVEAHLGIFEAPRYFERLVRGRTPDEVLDIVARICGICPVAYQMSAVHAFEAARGHRGRPRRPRPASPALLRRVDREPRPPRLLPPRPRLPGLRERHRAGPRPPRRWSSGRCGSRRPATTSCRWSAAGRSTRSRSGSVASTTSRRGPR